MSASKSLARPAAWVSLFYGIFCLFGGLIGYLHANSLPSLIAGSISSALLFLSTWGLFRTYRWAACLATCVALALGIRFGLSYIAKPQIMPQLIMVVLSGLMLAYSLTTLFQPRRTT